MSENENEKVEVKEPQKKQKKNLTKIKIILVLIAICIFVIIGFISYRAEYLEVISVDSKYETIFMAKLQNKYKVFATSAIVTYVFIYILNKFIKRGLNKFFKEENKQIPKLPNKSISFVLSLISGALASNMLADRFALIKNAAVFGQTDPIFGLDIGYYIFSMPFIQSLLFYIMEVLIFSIAYTALYYVITLNTCLDGVDSETLKKNTFIKQEIALAILLTIVFSGYILISNKNILTGTMLTVGEQTKIDVIGAGKIDVTVKLWGYRILAVVIICAVLRIIKYIRKENFKQVVISILIVPAYLLIIFVLMTGYYFINVGTNELDNEKEFIGYNIKNTKEAYGINLEQQNINSYDSISSEQITNNQDVINNIPVITTSVTLNAIKEHQENNTYYEYENTFLAMYRVDGKDRLVYVTPREILNDNTISYNNRTLKYTHGYSLIVSSANVTDSNGYAEYILSDFTSQDVFNIKKPRIYFGLETSSTIMTDTSFGKEYDYPLSATTNEENVYDGEAGLKLGFFDRMILGLTEKNLKLAFSSNVTKETKIIANRNIIERAKTIFKDIFYDEAPYLVVTDDGRMVWVIDGYTHSASYPYSKTTVVNIKGYKERVNYIRNSVKVLIDAYDGTTKFYITDKTDPIIMTYRNMYPDLFIEDGLPEDIQKHLVYPKFLYNIQADMINLYHDISEDSFYRAEDIWQISNKPSTSNSSLVGSKMDPYYTTVKVQDSSKSELGLVVTYSKLEKQNIISYLVGTVRDGKSELSLFKFNSESNVVGIMQLNNQIEQDATISKELEELNATGTKLIKDMIIVPIDNSLLYVEPVYQVMLNESEIPVLKKVIVASGNTVAIGNDLKNAISNLYNDDIAVDLEIVNNDDLEGLVDSVIKANMNLTESLNSNNFEMIGKDISSLQSVINQLQTVREKELDEKEKLEKEKNIFFGETENITDAENSVADKTNKVVLNNIKY